MTARGAALSREIARVRHIELTVHWNDGDRYHIEAITPERAIAFLKELVE